MQALQWLCDRLRTWAAAYRPELFCVVPLALLVLFGLFSAPWWGYAVLLAVLAMMVIICNPFHIWDRLLPPKTRLLMAAGLLIGLLPVSFHSVAPLAKLVLWGLAVGLWAVALWRRRMWLALWRIRQSPDVDTVLAHLSHDGDWQAGRAWEQYGCRETRALLHQTLWAECNEAEINRTYMPVYLLGYLHGSAARQASTRKAAAGKATLAEQTRQMQEMETELAALRADNAALEAQLAQAKDNTASYRAQCNALEQRISDMQMTTEERDAAILAYVEVGHSYTEAGAKYGLTKNGAVSAARRAKQKEAVTNA